MSAMPAEITAAPPGPEPRRVPGAQQQTLRRTERRAQQQMERRVRRKWAVLSCSIMAAFFGLTVGILDVLH
ncbi:MAG TPA: hypothetical protein VHV57_08730 [Acidimicrobiales bacterium]|jgi:hypothetical protein|nr:hypothetical protein [Acidimicrobiales bacterium]